MSFRMQTGGKGGRSGPLTRSRVNRRGGDDTPVVDMEDEPEDSESSPSEVDEPSPQEIDLVDDDFDEEILIEFDNGDNENDSDVELLLNTDDEREESYATPAGGESAATSNQPNHVAALANASLAISPARLPVLSIAAQRMIERAGNHTSPQTDFSSSRAGTSRQSDPEVVAVINRPRSLWLSRDETIILTDTVPNSDDDDDDEVELVVAGEPARPPSPVAGTSHSFSANRNRLGDIAPSANHEPSALETADEENEDLEDEDAEVNGPPQKVAKLDTSVRSEDDEGFICSICYDNFTNSGEHRVCCLKCGHVFGKECIEKWIQTQKRCPQCNCKALKRDIRILYVKNLKVMDTAELDRVKTDLQNSKEERSRVDLSNAYLRAQVDCKTKEILRLAEENKRLKQGRSSNETQEVIDLELGSVRTAESSNQQNNAFSSLRMPKIQLVKHFDIKEGNARVGAYNEWMNLLVVSHGITSALYPNGCYGIKKINSLDMKAFQSFPVHQRALRDMAFSQGQNDLLLTVGLDKKAVLFNCNSNCPVQTFPTQTPLWSCCWNTVNHNIFYVGSVMGKITSYDIRAPQEPLSTLDIPTNCKDAVARIKFVPPAYQNQAFNMSGLLIQKLNSMWFCEMLGGDDSDPRFHQLPLEGPFLNADFEPSSRHVLVSSRPKVSMGLKVGASHVVCSLGKVYSELEERDVFSCEIAQSITGGFQEASILCRSALVSPQPGQVYVAANGEGIRTVRIWDVANIEQKALVRLNQDAALDFVPGKVNEMNFLGIITDKSVDVYDMK